MKAFLLVMFLFSIIGVSAHSQTQEDRRRKGLDGVITKTPEPPVAPIDKRTYKNEDLMLPTFSNVLVLLEPERDAVTFSLQTTKATSILIEISQKSPVPNLSTKIAAGQKLEPAFPEGTQFAGFTFPGQGGVSTYHRATVRRAGGEVFEAGATYHYVITAKLPDSSFRRYINKFTVGTHRVKVVWDSVEIINDSDPDLGPIKDCGEINLGFFINGQKSLDIPELSNKTACTGSTYSINRENVIENAPNALNLFVMALDDDGGNPTMDFLVSINNEASFFWPLNYPIYWAVRKLGAPVDPRYVPLPADLGDSEVNVAGTEFDLAQFAPGAKVPFKLISSPANGGHAGDLMFTIYGHLEVSF
jgi:hypothetical protein